MYKHPILWRVAEEHNILIWQYIVYMSEQRRYWYTHSESDIKALWFVKQKEESKVPKEWSLFWESWYFVNSDSEIEPFLVTSNWNKNSLYKNVVPKPHQAEAILALCQLLQLRDETRKRCGDWKPDWNNYLQYLVHFKEWWFCFWRGNSYPELFMFPTEEIAKEFLEKHKSLLETYSKIYK
jgi:hypothetical protein